MAAPYSALARRYRPQSFDEVIGQDHIAGSLRNAIRNDRVAHGYIFTGARGTGKTSTARIFAKALNCPNSADGVPCNDCEVCDAIGVGEDVDVIEMDGASNRGIDEVRQLRSNATIRPMRARNKIYIIDEAHQLTKEAWNALLKTLEEPPPNVKFIFCTTKPDKLLDTVKSRCQRFDFSTVEMGQIITRLNQIAEAEGFGIEPDAVELVARRAAGSMRDSQSLLDQLLAFGSNPITSPDVHSLLGTAEEERLVAIADGIAAGEPGRALAEFDATLEAGVRIGELIEQMITYFRDLMVLASEAGHVPLISVPESRRRTLTNQAQQMGLNRVLTGLQILAEAAARMREASVARSIGDLAVARIALLGDLDALADLLEAVRSHQKGGGGRSADRSSRTSPQKKSPDSRSPAVTAAGAATATVAPQATKAGDLMAHLLAKTDERTQSHLRNASRSATTGPNALELEFPKRYSESCQYLTSARPRLEELIVEVTGQPGHVTVRTLEESGDEQVAEAKPNAPALKQSAKQATSPPRRRGAAADRLVKKAAIGDPFVERAMSIFETEEARLRNITGSSEG